MSHTIQFTIECRCRTVIVNQRVGHGAYAQERARPRRRLHEATRIPGPGAKETTVVLADLILIVPAALAGIGGVMLGDRVGLRIKTVLAERRRG